MARHLTQLSLDEDQYQALAALAEGQKRAVPDLVGELVDLGLRRLQERRLRSREALTRLGRLRRDLLARIGDASGHPVTEARRERDRQSDEALRPARK